MYRIFTNKQDAEKLQDDILHWYKNKVDVNATRWSDENKHQTQNKWAVPVPANFGYPVMTSHTDADGNTFEIEELVYTDTLVEELPSGWYASEGV